MFRFEKPIFLKLYHYYIKKLFFAWLLLMALVLFIALVNSDILKIFKTKETESIWDRSWWISLTKTGLLFLMSSNLIYALVNKGQKREDASVLTFTSPINRQNIFLAKIASFFTYYWVSNLLFSLLIVFLPTESSGSAQLIFLLFDSFFLTLITFLLFSTPFFYLYFPARNPKLKFLAFFLYFAFPLLVFIATFMVNRDLLPKIFGSPWIPALYSLFIGVSFLYFYWDSFSQHDYT
ncbi:hypothetical protein [endosymbiont GvMRE of Glomus versiforme]|uniref:hypothetical protein n=1 Tax=endosymbiont GvMRE of Glomus versiforme TaxID=2039283 RepID=UPI000EF0BEC4|nr:hypothetical protein [endosymbiont GvMRE of Glomus versiforme]RHZ36876.1 hypothetical protein GvMRE_I2g113 [endosymbiont GvMRE of Glomus versiforme]